MAPSTATVEWVGEDGFEAYSGNDAGVPVDLHPGKPIEVSAEFAAHLGEHFGHLVSIDGARPAKKNRPAPPADEGEGEPETLEGLMKLKRESLDDVARQLGISEPELLADKRTVATAILAVREDDEG